MAESDQADRDAIILAEASRIIDDKERRKAVQELSKKRKADELAGKGSLADKLRRRRIAVESGDLEGAQAAFTDVE